MSESPSTTPTDAAEPSPPGGRASASKRGYGTAIALTTTWIAISFMGVRIAWTNGEAKGVGLLFEIAAAVPLLYWATISVRGPIATWTSTDTRNLFLAAILLRCFLMTAEPVQSDDIYRYLWEGRVQHAGENPFRHAPEASELDSLRDENWKLINHPEYSAIYPPLAQWSFLLVATLSPCITSLKIFFTLCDLLTALVLLRWLTRLNRSPAWVALWVFHPLVIAEFSGNGHLDSLMILMTVTSLWCLDEGWDRRAMLALAGAIAAKLIPLLLLPYFLWKLKRKAWILAPPLLVFLSYLPYAGAGEGVWASLWIYQRDWLYNSPVFDFARDTLFGANGWLARYWFYGALALIGAVLFFFRAGPAAAALPVLGFYQAAGPVVHPWYLALFIALACVRRGGWPWLWLTAFVPLAYWGESRTSIRFLIWGPFLAGLIIAGVFKLRHRTQPDRDPGQHD